MEIKVNSDINQIKNEVHQYEEERKEYRILIDFDCFSPSSMEQKIELMNMIDEAGVNERVGEIYVALHNDNPIDSELIKRINRQWKNLYMIEIDDRLDSVDEERHNKLKEMVEEKKLLGFKLGFSYSQLFNSEDGLKLTKEYNSIIKRQEDMEELFYNHKRINEFARSR